VYFRQLDRAHAINLAGKKHDAANTQIKDWHPETDAQIKDGVMKNCLIHFLHMTFKHQRSKRFHTSEKKVVIQ